MTGQKPFDMSKTWLQCICCGLRTDLLEERKFRCLRCNNLFDVCHDFSLINGFTPESDFLQALFSGRLHFSFNSGIPSFDRSGIWRFRELIMPFLPVENIVTLEEGNVPIIRAGRNLKQWIGDPEIDLWLILEGMTPTGSFKDYGGTVLISIAKAAGIQAIVCASTGDTSAMAAAYAAAAGLKCAVILPEGKVTSVQMAQPLVHGAKVITLPTDFDGCMKVVEALVKDHGAYPANSLNPARIEGHQATVFQIAQFFGWQMPEWIAAPVGNGSNCSSIGKGMRLMKELKLVPHISRILGCQSEAANPLARSWTSSLRDWRHQYKPIKAGETAATAARIGDPVSRDKVMREIVFSNGTMITAKEHDLNDAVAACGKDGIFVCPQTGIALAGIRDALAKNCIHKGERVVVVSTATGLKFTEAAAGHLEREIIRLSEPSTEKVAQILGL